MTPRRHREKWSPLNLKIAKQALGFICVCAGAAQIRLISSHSQEKFLMRSNLPNTLGEHICTCVEKSFKNIFCKQEDSLYQKYGRLESSVLNPCFRAQNNQSLEISKRCFVTYCFEMSVVSHFNENTFLWNMTLKIFFCNSHCIYFVLTGIQSDSERAGVLNASDFDRFIWFIASEILAYFLLLRFHGVGLYH